MLSTLCFTDSTLKIISSVTSTLEGTVQANFVKCFLLEKFTKDDKAYQEVLLIKTGKNFDRYLLFCKLSIYSG